MPAKKTTPSFEESLNQLESIVEKLESGDLPLEEALQAFEQGINLTRQSQLALENAQSRINILLEQNGAPVEQPLQQQNTPASATFFDSSSDFDNEDIPF